MVHLPMIIIVIVLSVVTMQQSHAFSFKSQKLFHNYNRNLLSMSTVNAPGKSTFSNTNMREISSQMKDMRKSIIDSDPRAAMMIDALRGKNINDDDRQGLGVDMKIVEMKAAENENDVLPVVYDPAKLDNYFRRRPNAVFTRVWQIVSTSSTFFGSVLIDLALGKTQDNEVQRAAELRKTIVSLGPFFIKLGQALSIRPDILSPKAMVELQQLCDKVPCFDSKLAMETIRQELGRPHTEIFSTITPEPVAAASLGQVYRATLIETNEEVAVKVQRPFVLETVSLDLYLIRKIGLFVRNFPSISSRLDIVSLLDEFAGNFYQELDYNLECRNGIRIAKDMEKIPKVKIPRNYPDYTARRVHTGISYYLLSTYNNNVLEYFSQFVYTKLFSPRTLYILL